MAVVESSGSGVDLSKWRDFTNCDGISEPEHFPPGNGETVEEAKIVCRGCVAALGCFYTAVRNNRNVGIRKIMSAEEIDVLIEERRLADEASLVASD